ncbi:hypothetical protein Q3G72_014852 [Acer saccharum]|nr:hypothetical protein Q3G72_014852 [Acer saccharum]
MQMQFLKVGYESESLSGVLFDDLIVFVSWVQLGFANFVCLNSELMFVFLFIVLNLFDHLIQNHDHLQTRVYFVKLRKIMEMFKQILLPFFGVFALTVLVCAQDQPGFISLDCGLPRDDTYTEATTKINYISDANYIETGSGKSILPEYKVGKQQQMWSVRSFPEGIRNCYRLNLTTGEKYLIRAYFMYGNYDDANKVPSFDVYIGPNFWKTLNFENASTVNILEIIHVLPSDYLHFCLVNTDKGTPFISALELRLLKNTTYKTQSGSLELYTRLDIGSTTNQTYRYKDDVYDRIWWPLNLNKSRLLNTSVTIDANEEQDVDAITNIKATYRLKKNWQGDPCLPQTFLWDGLSCSNSSNDQPRITSLNLSSSGLSGGIAEYLSNLTMLESLDLSNNNLSGPVLEFLSQLPSLKVLNLERNKLTGLIPAGLLDRQKNNSLSLRFDGNPAALIGLWVLKRRKQQAVKMYPKSSKTYESLEQNKQQFTYSNVLKMTNNFERVLGKGGFGTVYYGRLDDTEVAVKMLSQSSAQGFKQFQSEVKLLMRVHHKDLTTLIGFCEEGTNLALIYEYMVNGNLGEHLLDNDKDILNWETRLRMAVEAAQGLEYLHHGYFGLSRTFSVEGDTHVSTVVAGTPGYLDPEYYMSNRRPTMNHVLMELNECLATETARRKENANEFETGDSAEMMTVNLHDDVPPLAR